MKRFENKTVLITGGTAGIGRATAAAFAAEGANVVLTGRRETEGRESLALVEQAGGRGLFVQGDISQEEDIAAAVRQAEERFGGLDIAFNNAGVLLDAGPITDATGEMIDRTYAINVRGVALSLKHEIPALLRRGGGSIINNASVLGLRPQPGRAIYNSSKYAVIGLTKTAALEFAAQKIRINAICPAIIETDMTAGLRGHEEISERVRSMHPVGRFGRPEEVAGAVLYLASAEAGFVTGVALPVDGGFAA